MGTSEIRPCTSISSTFPYGNLQNHLQNIWKHQNLPINRGPPILREHLNRSPMFTSQTPCTVHTPPEPPQLAIPADPLFYAQNRTIHPEPPKPSSTLQTSEPGTQGVNVPNCPGPPRPPQNHPEPIMLKYLLLHGNMQMLAPDYDRESLNCTSTLVTAANGRWCWTHFWNKGISWFVTSACQHAQA